MLRCPCTPLFLAIATFAVAATASASYSGVCPDGSVFIVQRLAAIPCPEAKIVDPHDMPPLHPELLPRPFGWERFNRRQDPNNPYNAIEGTRETLGVQREPENSADRARLAPRSAVVAAPPPPARETAIGAKALGLSATDLRDLSRIVELSQRSAPATVTSSSTAGEPQLTVRIARSEAFEGRLRSARAERGLSLEGGVVLFSAVAEDAASFYANLTFVQGHAAFHPDPTQADVFGLLSGRLGDLTPGQTVLGYAVLPATVEFGDPLDIYWNDRRVTAVLSP